MKRASKENPAVAILDESSEISKFLKDIKIAGIDFENCVHSTMYLQHFIGSIIGTLANK